ncbi:hypothetical protein EDD11_010039 [Mortierella claussenii]|nr:hypothetical protein EDD11_010039 [Mortierella claussenii]
MCACPGCLAYPSNQPVRSAVLAPDVYSDGNPSSSSTSNHRDISDAGPNMVRSASQKGSCCGSSKTKASDVINNSSTQALNLSQALSLIEASSQNISGIIDNDARQALRQNLMGQSGMEPVKMQHPTLLGDNGVLICGCGCGRPTVDCADCFRDMCEFVGESQARMMKEELEFDLAMNREGGYLSDLGLNMNMSMAMNMSLSMDMDINMDFNFDEEIEQVNDQGPARSRQGPTESTPLYHEDDLHQGRRQPSQQPTQLQYQKFSDQDQDQGQQQQDHQLLEREQRLRLQLMEQEQMQLSQLQPSTLNQLQLDFLDDEDWSFVDEIRTDGPDLKMLGIQPSDAA